MTDEFTNESADEAPVSEDVTTEKQPRFDNVRAYRHAATGALSQGREALSLRTDATHEVYSLINGAISEILRGRQGFGVEEQVAHLDDALAKVTEAKEALPEKIAAAKASIVAALDEWDAKIMGETQEAFKVLREAKEFAATRDFEAHQARKRERGGYQAFDYAPAASTSADTNDSDEDDSYDEDTEDGPNW